MTDKIKNADTEAFAMCMHDSASGSSLINPGLTKREYFAAMAMQGLLASYAGSSTQPVETNVAIRSVEYADAVLAKLETKHP